MRNFKFDRLKFNWAGEWVSNFQYIKDDIVFFKGKSYVCLNSHTSTDFEFDNNEFQNNVITFNVTVGIDSIENQSQGKFYIDGDENPELRLLQQRTYIFDQSDSTNVEFNESRNIFLLSLGRDGSLSGNKDIDTGISYFLDNIEVTKEEYINGFLTATDKSISITVTNDLPTSFYYYSVDNNNLGAEITAPYSSNWELMFDGKQWRGDWTVNTEYYLGNIVKFRGYLYECVETHLSTSVASLGVEGDREKWIVYAETYNYRANWQPQTNFTVGDVVKYNGINYLCITSHFSANTQAEGLEADQLNWIVFTRSDNWRQDWTTEVKYNVNDVVRYGGIVYRCIESHVSAENTNQGLEFDQASWEVVLSGVEYKQDWQSGFRYKLNDIVKYGSTLWICVLSHQSREELADDEDNWSIWLPGLEYEVEWDAETNYQVGDIVYYGGYIYAALNNNLNSIPSQVGLQQDFGDWELVTRSYNFKGNWNNTTQYRVGDVVRQSSYLYVARLDNESVYPDSSSTWELLIPGEVVVGEWVEDREYFKGDVVLRAGTAYLCIDRHSSATTDSRPDIDIEKAEPEYWKIFILGDVNNVLVDQGDLKTYDTDNVKLDIGLPGNILKVSDNSPAWLNYGQIDNIFYVSNQGTDAENFGTTQDAAFRTIKFATDFILADVDNRTPATIYIKTGLYEEQLPISVPSDVALVGDELRSTTVKPAAGFEQSDMFYVRNGSGIRNMSLQGLKGTLGEPNEYLTRRPTAGAYVSLDPGQGPDDESVWIKTKSCYVQNVTTQGEACIGMKIDGALHNGGNRSIVANDFTQVLSDGIGIWADNRGRSELVSVFTYFCHIGYLSTNGGILRGTNGNNSYGEFGSVAEGFDETETVKTASIDNRQNEAQFSDAFTFGTDEQKILAIGYSHAGQDYTSAEISFGGTGSFAEGNFLEFRDNAISNVRIIAPEDSTPEGGLNYTNVVNNAQGGDKTKIKLATADSGDPAEYISQRIVIESGLGVGQYAEIANYDVDSKEIIVSRETDGGLGWDHFQPGWPIEPELDETTRYRIEPRPIIDPPPFSTSLISTVPNGSGWEHIVYGSEWLAATGTADGSALFVSTSSDGSSWTAPQAISDIPAVGITYASGKYFLLPQSGQDVYIGPTFEATDLTRDETWIDIVSDAGDNILIISSMNIVASTDNGQTFTDIENTTVLDYSGRNFTSAGYGNGKFLIIDSSGDVLYSEDLVSWSVSEAALSTDLTYSKIAYGNNRFVALAADLGNNTTRFARSFDGINWYEETVEETAFSFVSYGAGVFIASGDTPLLAKSQDGVIWRTFNDDSVQYTLPQSGVYRGSAYHEGSWIITESTGNSWGQVQTGAEPIVRIKLDNARIENFEIYEPGSNYSTVPALTIVDNIATIDVLYEVVKNNGVLPQPEMTNRGEGYVNASAEITGDGFAEIFQTGLSLVVDNLTEIPGPGANIDIAGIDDERYSVTRVKNISGASGSFKAVIDIFPGINLFESPNHGTTISIRERYSQIRLTGHDFLDIGTGNEGSTRYPELYLEGESAENSRKPFNETVANGGGRVFYTSTDQDGNFRVGELFTVDQSTGIVTISASQFDLGGLEELSLGGIQVGGTAVIIREFSKDTTFTANSDNIVPTEAAIKGFLESRISGGSANAEVNVLIAGQVEIGTNTMNTTSEFPIRAKTKMNLLGGIDGTYLALQFFANAHNYESPDE